MRISFQLILSSILIIFTTHLAAKEPLPTVHVTVISSGTVNWELQHLKNMQLDHSNGFNLVIDPVASLSAARIAITSGNADFIVSDWLWVTERNMKGANLRFIPFSQQIGSIIAAKDSKMLNFSDLKGKRVGIAGGPLNKGWVLLRAAAKKEGIDLQNDVKIQFGAPPLLNQALRSGQLDMLATFWHYGARLEAEGYSKLYSLKDVMKGLGLTSDIPMLGYLFNQSFEDQHPTLVAGFYRAVKQAKAQLAIDDEAWTALRPLMKVENDAIYQGLVAGYRAGIPSDITQEQIEDAVNFYQMIDELKPYPSGTQLNPELFYKGL
ncbi:ABC transporter substrate-binding protein [Neptuniibacter marinus]|uniref:ABC transporter substrate-binding protein n=1 Tax=Neptuniibacter marinus TaxID=1806670 RepID=UPI000836E5F6|nr:ABC transporter substrate-binding protein [Neptuniibacter marinus]